MSTNTSEVFYKMFTQFIDTVRSTSVEVIRLLPDSFFLGVAILAGLSMCKSYGVLLLTMIEIMIVQNAFSKIIGGIMPSGAGPNALNTVCQPGFSFPNNMRYSILEKIGTPSLFPSPTLFFLTGVMSYMIFAMQQFKREIVSLSGEINTRVTVATVLSAIFVLIVLIFRSTYGCESFGSLIVSSILGTVLGGILVYQNMALFGKDGINILNIPILQTSLEAGKPLYVCKTD